MYNRDNPVETTRQRLMNKAYILGALHDATKRKTTYRIAQKSRAYVELIAKGIKQMGGKAWTYKEGKKRHLYIVEFSQSFLNNCQISSIQDKTSYIQGYFDTDGGIAKSNAVRYYLYFCQKNYQDLATVREMLTDLKISCGKIHNPSSRVDPNYWRFYISAKSYFDFAKIIGSLHPQKKLYMRMKI